MVLTVDDMLKEIRELKELFKIASDIKSNIPKRLLTVAESAEYLGIGRTEAYSKLRLYVTPIKHGKKLLFPREELDNLVEESKIRGSLFF